ncbi:uncharacterized protein [Apostichopus japonicus]|uniref:uncharacterized protein isoform X1 n=1 Tax=Stichopus japonicus TaxID=307972 RepID=UPI003AB8A851
MSLTNVSPKCSPAATSVESSSLPTSQKDSMEVNDDFRWARFFRELAGILVLYLNIPGQAWLELLKKVGASQNDLDDVISQDLDPEIQVYKLLNKSKAAHSNTQDWWRIFSREITKVRNDNFSEDVQKAYEKFISCEIVDSLSLGKSLPSVEGTPPCSPTPTPPPCIPKHSQSFEVINEDEVIRSSEEIKSRLKEEIDVEISDPEVSQQIDNVRRVIQDIAGKTQQYQLSLQLAGAASQILKMETSYRATQTLKDILDQENEINKKEKIRLIKENEAQSQEIQSLKQEIEELKKTTADKNLNDFDVITKREAHELAETKKSVPAASATVTVDESNTVNIDAYHNLQARCIKVTKQRDQLVKINHQWDQEYHDMEKTLRNEHQKLYQDLVAKDEEIMAGKRLIASLEKEKNVPSAQLMMVLQEKATLEKAFGNEKSKRKKYHEYATRLNQQKDKLQREVARLNQVLSQETRKGTKSGATAAAAPGKEELDTEIALYRQQAEYFEKDFREEQREKRRLMGELEAAKTELLSVKRKLRKVNDKVQVAQDQKIAQQLQAERNGENFYFEADHQEPTPRGLNFAGNDRFVDGGLLSSFGSIEADGVDGRKSPSDKNSNACPRCQAYISDEQIFFQHLDRCLEED